MTGWCSRKGAGQFAAVCVAAVGMSICCMPRGGRECGGGPCPVEFELSESDERGRGHAADMEPVSDSHGGDTGQVQLECPADLFRSERGGQGWEVREVCSTCSTPGLRCVRLDSADNGKVLTVCVCDGAHYECSWQRVPDGYLPCVSTSDCSDSRQVEEDGGASICVHPCDPGLSPFCAVSCTAIADCSPGWDCIGAFSVEHLQGKCCRARESA